MLDHQVGLSHAERARLRKAASKYVPDRIAARRSVSYACPRGHDFTVTFADDAEVPDVWECRQHGADAAVDDDVNRGPKRPQKVRTHWDMLRERRSIPELEVLLTERLEARRVARMGRR